MPSDFVAPGTAYFLARAVIPLPHLDERESLMFRRPNFCCHCGEAISRPEWTVFKSRRYCDLCESDHLIEDWIPTVVTAVAMGFGILGITGYFAPRATGGPAPMVRAPSGAERREASRPDAEQSPKPAPTADRKPSEPKSRPGWTCGAETRKGTLCTRKVSAEGDRCWQHR